MDVYISQNISRVNNEEKWLGVSSSFPTRTGDIYYVEFLSPPHILNCISSFSHGCDKPFVKSKLRTEGLPCPISWRCVPSWRGRHSGRVWSSYSGCVKVRKQKEMEAGVELASPSHSVPGPSPCRTVENSQGGFSFLETPSWASPQQTHQTIPFCRDLNPVKLSVTIHHHHSTPCWLATQTHHFESNILLMPLKVSFLLHSANWSLVQL